MTASGLDRDTFLNEVSRDNRRTRQSIKNEILVSDDLSDSLNYSALETLSPRRLSMCLRDRIFPFREVFLSSFKVSRSSAFAQVNRALDKADCIVDALASCRQLGWKARDTEYFRCLLSNKTFDLHATEKKMISSDTLWKETANWKEIAFPQSKKKPSSPDLQTALTSMRHDGVHLMRYGSASCFPLEPQKLFTNISQTVHHEELCDYQICISPDINGSLRRERVIKPIKYIRCSSRRRCEHIHKLSSDVPSWGAVTSELCSFKDSSLNKISTKIVREHGRDIDDGVESSFASPEIQNGFSAQRESCVGRRSRIWASALGSRRPPHVVHCGELTSLRTRSLQTELPTETCVRGVCDFAQYFPLSEFMLEVVVRYICDAVSPYHYQVSKRNVHAGRLARNFLSFAAPLCFVCPRACDVHVVLKELHARHFSRLQVHIKDYPGSNLSPLLSHFFEDIIQSEEPEIAFHLLSHGIVILRIASPWMLSAFVTHLGAEEVLLLWDNIVKYNSVLPLAVAAAAVISFRREALLKTKCDHEIFDTLEDLSSFPVVSIMKDFQSGFSTNIPSKL